MIAIKTYNGKQSDFYIQAKGYNAGKPLKKPIPNCFAVNTNITNAYEIVYSLWKSGFFECYITGSVIPFIKVTDVKKIVSKAIEKAELYDTKSLNDIKKVDKAIQNMEKKIKLLKQMQKVLAIKANNEVKYKL